MKKRDFNGLISQLKKSAKKRGGFVLNDEINELLTDEDGPDFSAPPELDLENLGDEPG